jgi:acyl dehydratase
MAAIAGIQALRERLGEQLGSSDWLTIDQARIQAFADATDDHQWIHIDVERAKRESPFGTTIAHGYLTLSLLPMLRAQAFEVEGVKTRVNYGLNKLRFPSPVPAGSRIRGNFKLLSVDEQKPGQYLVTLEASVEREGGERPACVAEMLGLYIV